MRWISCVGLCLSGVGGCLAVTPHAAGAASEPPPVVLHSPHSRHLAAGESATFRASAEFASTVVWVLLSPSGSIMATDAGANTMTKRGVLRSSFTFGPFVASEDGWQVRAEFVNDPTGVPSGIQVTGTTPAIIHLKKRPVG
jgi:hypothetical protein